MDKNKVASAIQKLKGQVCDKGKEALDELAEGLGVDKVNALTPKVGQVWVSDEGDLYLFAPNNVVIDLSDGTSWLPGDPNAWEELITCSNISFGANSLEEYFEKKRKGEI